MPAEKNDIDISVLFNFGKEVEIIFADKSIPAFIRLVGDAELNRARVHAIRKSAELRKKLKNFDSDEAIALLPDTDDFSEELIMESIITLSTPEITKKIMSEMDFPYPNEPDSEASLEEQEKYQEDIDNFPANKANKIKEETLKKLNVLREELKPKSKKELDIILKDKIIQSHCEREMVRVFQEMCAYFGSYKDKNYKTRLFESYEQFENLLTEVKNQILTFYDELEIDSETLKK